MTWINSLFWVIFLIFSVPIVSATAPNNSLRESKVSTESKQSQMTPKQALKRLKDGNERFLNNKRLQRNYLAQAKQSSYGQYPWVVVLNCMDSRSVPEFIFDQGLADMFTLRVAGNVLNEDILGSLEFATKVAGARLIVVLGHTSCGAVAGACEGVQLGHLNHVLDQISPLVEPAKKDSGLSSCSKPELVNLIAKNNALHVAREIQQQSPIIQTLITNGQVGIVAGMHDLRTGKVTFFEEGRLIP
ncbi:carbonic anhydrase family protein [Legionella yabuuchiae]|uniref:carbonic anhydrase family protein n=1 Tax=Legionella yabuuchiae TaxID=376727 RepID=UPI001055F8D7|nr:carbonic anhydrase family protein [Legionella yabuuchiae]